MVSHPCEKFHVAFQGVYGYRVREGVSMAFFRLRACYLPSIKVVQGVNFNFASRLT